MRVLNMPRLEEACRRHRDAETALRKWLTVVQGAKWSRFLDVRSTYRSSDTVKVASGMVLTIFDIRGNVYRLITFVDYRRQAVTVLHFLTHAEYDKENWKA